MEVDDAYEPINRGGGGKKGARKKLDVAIKPALNLDLGIFSNRDMAVPTSGDFLVVSIYNAVVFLLVMGLVIGETGDLRSRPLFLNLFGLRDKEYDWAADPIAMALGLAFVPVIFVAMWLIRQRGELSRISIGAGMLWSCLLTDAGIVIYQAHFSGMNDLFSFLLLLSVQLVADILIFRLRGTESLPDGGGAQKSSNGDVAKMLEADTIYLMIGFIFSAPVAAVLLQRFLGPIDVGASDGTCQFCGGLSVIFGAFFVWLRNYGIVWSKFNTVSELRNSYVKSSKVSQDADEEELSGRRPSVSQGTAMSKSAKHLRHDFMVLSGLFGLGALLLAVFVGIGANGDASFAEKAWGRFTWVSNGKLERSERWPVASLLPAAFFFLFLAHVPYWSKKRALDLDEAIEQDTSYLCLPAFSGLADAALFFFTGPLAGLSDIFALAIAGVLLFVSSILFVHLGRGGTKVFGGITWLLASAPYALAIAAFARADYLLEFTTEHKATVYTLAAIGLAKAILSLGAFASALRHSSVFGHRSYVLYNRPILDVAAITIAYSMALAGDVLRKKDEA